MVTVICGNHYACNKSSVMNLWMGGIFLHWNSLFSLEAWYLEYQISFPFAIIWCFQWRHLSLLPSTYWLSKSHVWPRALTAFLRRLRLFKTNQPPTHRFRSKPLKFGWTALVLMVPMPSIGFFRPLVFSTIIKFQTSSVSRSFPFTWMVPPLVGFSGWSGITSFVLGQISYSLLKRAFTMLRGVFVSLLKLGQFCSI